MSVENDRHNILHHTIWKNLKMRDDDIIISSTVKSGTTWLQQIIGQLIFEGEFDDHFPIISPWIDNKRDHTEQEVINVLKSQNHRRFYKTHSPADIVLQNPNLNPKYIFITRDFRDVVWSFYNHFTNSKYPITNKNIIEYKLRQCKSPYEFWTLIMNNIQYFSHQNPYRHIWSYFNTINSWTNVMKNECDSFTHIKDNVRDNILILHYNDLKLHYKETIQKISHFLGYSYDPNGEIMNKVYKKGTFEWMKKHSHKCAPKYFNNGTGSFINKGVNHRWKGIIISQDLDKYNTLMDVFFKDDILIDFVENGSY